MWISELDSFLETNLTQSRIRITNCFLSSIFRNAIPGNDSFLLLSLFLSAGDKRKREEKRKKERGIDRDHCTAGDGLEILRCRGRRQRDYGNLNDSP